MSTINPIGTNITGLLNTAPVAASGTAAAGVAGEKEGSFADILTAALNNVAQTDAQDKSSTLELLTGQTDDLVGLMMDSQKAELALNLSLQLRNKVLDAYKEIMSMQV